jgi:hypothetical protein
MVFLYFFLEKASSYQTNYSPGLNPAEHIWNVLRRNYFANRVFDSLNAATEQAKIRLAEMAASKSAIRQLTNWPWISAILKT